MAVGWLALAWCARTCTTRSASIGDDAALSPYILGDRVAYSHVAKCTDPVVVRGAFLRLVLLRVVTPASSYNVIQKIKP